MNRSIKLCFISSFLWGLVFFFACDFGERISLRHYPATLAIKDAREMIIEKGFYDYHKNRDGRGLSNRYQVIADSLVVHDRATGLMWERAGSMGYMRYSGAADRIALLNEKIFAGYNDWRLPTLEEAMSLMEPFKEANGMFIKPVFDKRQIWIWTADTESSEAAWRVFYSDGYCGYYDGESTSYVRAVRSAVAQ